MIKESFNTRRCRAFGSATIIHRLHGVRLQCLCIKMFCLHWSVVLYRYRNESNGAMMAEMEDGVASTEQSTQ